MNWDAFFRIYWAAWLIVSIPVTFAIPEVAALVSGHGEWTLSAWVWDHEQFIPGQSMVDWSAVHFLVTGLMILIFFWLIFHFGFGIWR